MTPDFVTPEMIKKLDDLLYMAKTGKKAPEIASLLNISQTNVIYHTLLFFELSIAKLRADTIKKFKKEHPTWTQKKLAKELGITVDALRNHLHYKRHN